jgi:uncharacterized damage-inducible protein DinB
VASAPAQDKNPLSADTKAVYGSIQNTILRAAEKMPEEHYSFRPTPEVRTYGQIVAHIADSQYLMCGAEKGEKRATPDEIEKTRTTKADLLAALKEAIAYCDASYDSMTDARASEKVSFFGRDRTRLMVLNFNIAHTLEHYGNLATYLRMKGLVPPTSESQRR